MGRIWLPGSGGGADLDVITAGAGDVLSGKVIVDAEGNPLTGTLALTGDAADSQVLAGKTYYNTDAKTKRTGSMPNQGAVSQALNAGGSYVIPAGYHNGAGKVTANGLAGQTSATAVAADILNGKTAWVNGSKVTGSMAVLAGGTYTPGTSPQTISCSGKKMTSNIVIGAIPSTYADIGSGAVVFNNGSFSYGYGWGPKLKRSASSPYYEKTGNTCSAYTSQGFGAIYYNALNKSMDLTKINKIIFTWVCSSAETSANNDDGDIYSYADVRGSVILIKSYGETRIQVNSGNYKRVV